MAEKIHQKDIITAIRMRVDLPYGTLPVSLLLKVGEMEQYTTLCCSRIADENLIDGEDVKIDFNNFPDILLTFNGMRKCRKILECYLQENIITDAGEALADHKILCDEVNCFLADLRASKTTELIKSYWKLKRKDTETSKLAAKYISTEVASRSVIAKAARAIIERYRNIYMNVKYGELFKEMKLFNESESEKNSQTDKHDNNNTFNKEEKGENKWR